MIETPRLTLRGWREADAASHPPSTNDPHVVVARHRAVLARTGEFGHPDLPPGDPLARHILYRIDRPTL